MIAINGNGIKLAAPGYALRAVTIHAAAAMGDDGTNDLLVSNVLRLNEFQVWFVAEQAESPAVARYDETATRELTSANA